MKAVWTCVVALLSVVLSTGVVGEVSDADIAEALDACGVGVGSVLREGPLGLPVPEGCTGSIRPGALMTAPSFCTFNFIYTDGADLYTGTAGHCVSGVGQRVSASGVGAFGTVVFRMFEGGADDFALIRIDAAMEGRVDPTMCTWGGPVGVQTGGVGTGSPILEYGWGVATESTQFTRNRVHSAFGASDSITWNGVGSGGDSGAPVTTFDGNAYGIHTFGLTPIAGVVLEGGPHIQHILSSARAAGFDIDVVTG